MKKQKWSEKPVTWGGYLKLSGVCFVISTLIAACYEIWYFEIHPIKKVKEVIHTRFGRKTDEE